MLLGKLHVCLSTSAFSGLRAVEGGNGEEGLKGEQSFKAEKP